MDGLHDADEGVDPGGELNMIALGLDKGCLVDQLVNSVLQTRKLGLNTGAEIASLN